jgi:hypothetical protein
MSSIICQKVGIYTYIYDTYSKWDTNKKYSTNVRKKIGKIDPNSGKALFLPEFLESIHDNPSLLKKLK